MYTYIKLITINYTITLNSFTLDFHNFKRPVKLDDHSSS